MSLEENASSSSNTRSISTKMEAQKQFPEEYSKSLQICFVFLEKFNIRYLEDHQPFLKKYWRFFYIFPALLIHLITLSSHLVILISNEQMIDVAYMLPPYLVSIHGFLKALVIVPKTPEISVIIKDLGGLWRTKFTKEQSIEKDTLLRRLDFCNKVNYWVSLLGTLQYLISPLFETLFRRYVLQQPCDLLLPLAASYAFDPTTNWGIYLIVYAFQAYSMIIVVLVYMGAELIMTTLCALLGAEFMMLKEDLARAKPMTRREKDEEIHEYTIEAFIKRHQKLIRLSRQLDNVFNRMIFIDLLFVGITTCAFSFAGEFARGLTYTINNYVAVVFSLFTVLYLCYYAELLTSASARLGDVAYQNLWYEGHTGYKKATWLIIKISQRPCCLTSLQYAQVSLNLFTKVVSTTWSYFSLMNSVYTVEEE